MWRSNRVEEMWSDAESIETSTTFISSSTSSSSSSSSLSSTASSFSPSPSPFVNLLHMALISGSSTSSTSSFVNSSDYYYDTYDDAANFSLQSLCNNNRHLSANFSGYEYDGRTETWIPITWREVLKLLAYFITFIVSLVGNVLVILVVRYNRNMRSSINHYLVNLAVADLLVTLVCKWVHLVRHFSYPHYVLPAIVCKLDGFVQGTALVASVFTLTVISIGRFVAIMFPLHARTSPDRAIRVIAAIWISSAVLSSPTLLYRELYSTKWSNFTTWNCDELFPIERKLIDGICWVMYDAKTVFYMVFTVICYVLPVTIMFITYSLIVWKLWGAQQPGEVHHQQAATTRNMQRVVRMVTVVLVVFVICWTPLQSLILYNSLKSYNMIQEEPGWLEFTAYFVAHSNSTLNPIIYCGFNANFRQGLVALVTCKQPRRDSRTYQPKTWWGRTGTGNYSANEVGLPVQLGSVLHSRLTQRSSTSSSSLGSRLVYSCPGRELRHDNYHHNHHLCHPLSNPAKNKNENGSFRGTSHHHQLNQNEAITAQRTFVRTSYKGQNGTQNPQAPHCPHRSYTITLGSIGERGMQDQEECVYCYDGNQQNITASEQDKRKITSGVKGLFRGKGKCQWGRKWGKGRLCGSFKGIWVVGDTKEGTVGFSGIRGEFRPTGDSDYEGDISKIREQSGETGRDTDQPGETERGKQLREIVLGGETEGREMLGKEKEEREIEVEMRVSGNDVEMGESSLGSSDRFIRGKWGGIRRKMVKWTRRGGRENGDGCGGQKVKGRGGGDGGSKIVDQGGGSKNGGGGRERGNRSELRRELSELEGNGGEHNSPSNKGLSDETYNMMW